MDAISWNAALDALEFTAPGHGAACLVHRRALGTLLGRGAEADACLALAMSERGALERAARAKIARAGLAPGTRFHLTSRDLRAAGLGEASGLQVGPGEAAQEQPGEDAEQRP